MRALALMLLIALAGRSQNLKTDFQKINEKYNTASRLSMNVVYELYYDGESKPSETESGAYRKNQDRYFIEQSGNEMLVTDKHVIVVDKEAKTVILDQRKGRISPADPLAFNLDSLLKFYEKTDYFRTGNKEQLAGYSFYLKHGLYSRIDVVFDPRNWEVREITNHYREKMTDENDVAHTLKLRTHFTQIDFSPTYFNDFKESKYVVGHRNIIKLSRAYTSYKLLTHLKNL